MRDTGKSPGKRKSPRSLTPSSPTGNKRARLRSESDTKSPAVNKLSRRRSTRACAQPLYHYSSEDASPPPARTRGRTEVKKKVEVKKGKPTPVPKTKKKEVKESSESEEDDEEEEEAEDTNEPEKAKSKIRQSFTAVVAKANLGRKTDLSKSEPSSSTAATRRTARVPVPRKRLSQVMTLISKSKRIASASRESPSSSPAAGISTRRKRGKAEEDSNSTPATSTLRRTRKKVEPETEANKEATPNNTSTLKRTRRNDKSNDETIVPATPNVPAVKTRRSEKIIIKATPDASTTPRTRKTVQSKAKTDNETTPTTSAAGTPRSKRIALKKAEAANEATPTSSTPQRSGRKVQSKAKAEMEATPRSSRRLTLKASTSTEKATPVKATPVKAKPSAEPKPSTSKAALQEAKGKANAPAPKGVFEWKFNVYGIPKCPLPCRENQFEEIWKFLFENITEKNSGCMYVSGVPGTGKTVIVQAVVDTMQKLTEDKKKKIKFQFLYINGLTLASPDKIWKRMFKGLGLPNKYKGISTKEALKRLDSHFESHQRDPVILVVDELDQILDKQQSILYQLLEWSSHSRNMFSFVAIFNTMSLPENGLAMRNYSRMGFKRAVFPPYSYDQLQTIVANMLSTFKTERLNAECVSLLSRKVAAISGDARRALEIARRAMEIAENGSLSGIQAVSNAFKEIFSSAKIETIKYTSLLEQLILKTICDEIRSSGVEEVLIAKIYESVLPKVVYEGMNWPKDQILKAMMRLAVMRVLLIEDNSTSIHKRVLLKVPVEDVNFALGIHTDLAA